VNPAAAPGLHLRLPYPFERVDKVNVSETRTVSVGFEEPDQLLGRTALPRQAEFLTGDQNIINLRLVLQFTVSDPVKFLTSMADPVAACRRAAEASLTNIVGRTGVDDLVGPQRVAISHDVAKELQTELDRLSAGITVSSANLQTPLPPQEVAAAFNDVANARQEMEQVKFQAEGYKNEAVLRAQGEADKLSREGEAYRQQRVAQAEGEAKRFDDLYAQYRDSKDVTSLRLYIEAMEEILPKMKKVIVDSAPGREMDLGIIKREP
jgi:membrane protease subunit HflK